MQERNQNLRRKVFKRDNFTCQKCKLQNKTSTKLEAHHIIPLGVGGNDNISNLITLCFDCHHFAPNNKIEFDEYMGEKMDGTLTTLIKAWNKVRRENPELFNKANEN